MDVYHLFTTEEHIITRSLRSTFKGFHDLLFPYTPNDDVRMHTPRIAEYCLLLFWIWLHNLLCGKLNDFLEAKNKKIGSTNLSVTSLNTTRFIYSIKSV